VGADCAGTDCNDADGTCYQLGDVCCSSCVDIDGDGYGVGDGCLGADCNDGEAGCSTAGDACCVDCLDLDGDGYGAGLDCAGLDCVDSDPTCFTPGDACCTACNDSDGDGFGEGQFCLGLDCNDANPACWIAGSACCFVLTITAVDPAAVSRDVGGTITVTGTSIDASALVSLINCDTQEATEVGVAVVAGGGTSATVTVAANPALAQGLYQVQVTNPDLETAVSACELFVIAGLPPTVETVVPPFAYQGDPTDGVLSDQLVAIDGTGFRPTPTVRFVLDASPAIGFDAPLVSFLDETQLTAVAPSESRHMPLGLYQVHVVNPNGLSGRWAQLFEVTSTPPPRIDNVDPSRLPINDCTLPFTVTGGAFVDGAVVSLLVPAGTATCPDGTVPGPDGECPVPTTFFSSSELRVQPTASCFSLGFYPVRVTNPDTQHATWFAVEVRDPTAGHLNDQFVQLPQRLEQARERHDAVEGFDPFGNAYLITAGGTDTSNAALDTVEACPVSLLGTAGSWQLGRQYLGEDEPRGLNRMTTPRTGLALVRVGRWLYAIGGAAQDTNVTAAVPALASVERARLLGYETRPQAFPPRVIGGNGLPVGSWFYRVSALGPEGESLASSEVFVNNAWGRIRVCWGSVTGATTYHLYRSLAADGRAGTARLIATSIPATAGINCFVDDGQTHLAEGWYLTPAPGRLRGLTQPGGSLAQGRWSYRVSAVRDGRETVAGYLSETELSAAGEGSILLRWDPIPGATYNLYRVASVDGTPDTLRLLVGGLALNEHLDTGVDPLADPTLAPPDGVAPLPPGSLTLWEELPAAQHLATAREGLDAVAVTLYDGDPDTTGEPVVIYAVGGRPDNSGTGYLATVERAQVLPDGTLTPWTTDSQQLSHARAFFPLLSSQGQQETPYPGQPEQPPCLDNDGDGFAASDCGGIDCDDSDATVYPGAPDPCGDGIDQDCNGVDSACDCTVADADGDGFARLACGGTDCDDGSDAIYPGAPEVCGDGIDQDCNGVDSACDCTVADADGDGYDALGCGGTDCNDGDDGIHPDAIEVACDGIDQDCNGFDLCFVPWSLPLAGDARVSPWASLRFPEIVRLPFLDPVPSNLPVPPAFGQETAGPFHLIAALGDEAFGFNSGSDDFDACAINLTDGSLGPCDPNAAGEWALQDVANDSHRRRGHGGLLYFDYVYLIGGVQRDGAWGQEPATLLGNVSRFAFDAAATDPNRLLGGFQSANGNLQTYRGYFAWVRLAGKIFVMGGNDGTGPIDSMEINDQ
jgi:hypothetical protein